MEKTREKIAILGGGISALTAAYELATLDRYDITVYQLGWRLGGKGASGRNQSIADRIEEHGLHIWFGFYENAFSLMRRCYAELQTVPAVERNEYQPFETARLAFTGQDTFVLAEKAVDGWVQPPWTITFPGDDDYFPGEPGSDGQISEFPSLWEYLLWILEFSHRHFEQHLKGPLEPHKGKPRRPYKRWRVLRTLGVDAGKFLKWAYRFAHALELKILKGIGFSLLGRLLRKLGSWLLLHLLRHFKHWLNEVVDEVVRDDPKLRRVWILVDLALTTVVGMLADDVLRKGLNSLNHWTFKQWLARHEADPLAVNSPPVQALHDAAFAYEDGDTGKPNMAAGVALRAILRILLSYKGHIFFKMNAGMGDAIFAPLYLVLKERYSVRFKFFHRVKELKLSPDGNLIQQIRVARQVDLKDGKETDKYQPLIPVHGLPCWPNRPDQDQIVQDLKQTPEHPEGVDLESRWAEWTDAEEHTLVAGEHFDQVILGISLAALPFLCPELKEKSSAWRDMLHHLKTVKTQSVQLWFQPTDNELGWPVESGIVGSFAEPYASWADFDQLQGRESWTGFLPQNSVFYCCNVLKDGEHPLPPPSEHDFPKQQLAEATEQAMEVLRQDSGYLWPQGAGSSGQLEWALLTAPEDLKGERRARDFQYFRANVDPTERYVLSIAQPKQYRLKSGESGFDNLFLTGTWTDNGFNLSSVEAAVMSGMQASRAISGVPIRIVGENDFLD